MDDAIAAGLVAIGAVAASVILIVTIGPSLWGRSELAMESEIRSSETIRASVKILDAEPASDRCLYVWVKNTGNMPIDPVGQGNVYISSTGHDWGGSMQYVERGPQGPGTCGGILPLPRNPGVPTPVSYTHLTLPTILLV